MRGEGVFGVNWGESGRREKGERRREKGEGNTLHIFHRALGYHVPATYFRPLGYHVLAMFQAPRLPCAS